MNDLPLEVISSLQCTPRFEVLFLPKEERSSWEQFVDQHGCGPNEIGEFVYGADENPWS